MESDTTKIQINEYRPIDNRETFVELSNTHESVTNIIDFYGTEVKKYWLFELIGFLQFGEDGIYPYEFGQITYKTLACNVASMSSESPGQAYVNCIYQDDLFFQDKPFNDKLNEIVPEMNDIYMEIMNEDDKTIVIFPTVSLHAYSERCIWDYYMPASDDCKIIQLNNDIDLSSMNNNIWLNPAWKSLSGYFLYNTNVISFQILGNLNYEILSDIEIEKNPSILESYDKIIVLQNKYVTKKMFDAITNHPKVIYLTPGALSEEVKIDFTNNTITVLSPIKYPEEKNYRNDFSWEYDNTDREFEDCSHSNDPKFEKVSNGIMTNCVSENLIGKSKEFLKIIKDY